MNEDQMCHVLVLWLGRSPIAALGRMFDPRPGLSLFALYIAYGGFHPPKYIRTHFWLTMPKSSRDVEHRRRYEKKVLMFHG